MYKYICGYCIHSILCKYIIFRSFATLKRAFKVIVFGQTTNYKLHFFFNASIFFSKIIIF